MCNVKAIKTIFQREFKSYFDSPVAYVFLVAFLAGAVTEQAWFDQQRTDLLRHHVLLVLMPVFFLSTGLRTAWNVGGAAVFLAAGLLLVAAVIVIIVLRRLLRKIKATLKRALGDEPAESALPPL